MKSLGLSPTEQEVVDMQVVAAALKKQCHKIVYTAGHHEGPGPVPLNTVHYGHNVPYCYTAAVLSVL